VNDLAKAKIRARKHTWWSSSLRPGSSHLRCYFLACLFRQFGLVEVAASLGAGVEVFFLSSSIGDLFEDAPNPNRRRFTPQ
jgi:hypothetical protein